MDKDLSISSEINTTQYSIPRPNRIATKRTDIAKTKKFKSNISLVQDHSLKGSKQSKMQVSMYKPIEENRAYSDDIRMPQPK